MHTPKNRDNHPYIDCSATLHTLQTENVPSKKSRLLTLQLALLQAYAEIEGLHYTGYYLEKALESLRDECIVFDKPVKGEGHGDRTTTACR